MSQLHVVGARFRNSLPGFQERFRGTPSALSIVGKHGGS
jgi:hypothetical protein